MLEVAADHDQVELIVLPPLCPVSVPSTDFRHPEELIRRARCVTLHWLDDGSHRRPHSESVQSLHSHPDAMGTPDGHLGRAA